MIVDSAIVPAREGFLRVVENITAKTPPNRLRKFTVEIASTQFPYPPPEPHAVAAPI
ncbi:MAG: hypothetical protein HC849_11505 [Oscillatoriales cyanobacterium RU_3_3]|nr:hypothetical protein [Microcoleus sp. SU_5_6]NJM60681.1 hypothetical protein [Oscillatoriales cyanobacterium RU_3_3]